MSGASRAMVEELADWFHLRSSGAAIFTPDAVTETWEPATDHGDHDGDDGRALRYLEWSVDPDPSDATIVTDFAIMLREADGTTRPVHDRHVEGLCPRATWLELLGEAGFEARRVPDRWGRDLFVGRRHGTAAR